ncbi:uncharacterized protein LOC117164015 [Bombus vancouverensis nearcticus]|uniref:uncharacterized protein LOC117164015 n=1 Tax=Bombus vancouverensis nearcticus TaxID=2705178 RepID=UPI00143C0314|nr:uncharacterized protein LOC117164015 [Bombus vancouverensis nearcticus]XP_033203148.1 uncharacterized protein LOC117164303 [Bombus vancouverensis nearcticus]XP_033203149.1 uncharacterized protein LOC117164303 [Bombus vancouverensis nearcticus]XP_033203150.1 uncharacterized protein LOC117164303 [Bombus vancouverensis nearcticus]XP_033203158.1 uncharacterized protein LOC117164316 [Bombus vancouverensis nearcticus]XP_033203606.1 uncharacterized protein LOC117164568 [Bombus vancouverensis nearc
MKFSKMYGSLRFYLKMIMIAVCVPPALLFVLPLKTDATNNRCADFEGETIRHDLTFEPGPSVCSFCVCYNSRLKWCISIVCNPPVPCRKFRLGKRCCDFECLDHVKNITGTGEIYVLEDEKSSSSSTHQQT